LEATYSLSFTLSENVIKPGESFEVELYISGFGSIKQNKLQIYYSTLNFIDPDDPGYVVMSGKKEGNMFKFGDKFRKKHFLGVIGSQIGLTPHSFRTRDEYEGEPDRSPRWIFPMVNTEYIIESTPPLLFRFNTKKTIRSGDYDVDFIFTYTSDGTVIKTAQKSVTIHVTSLTERHSTTITIFQLIVGVLAVIGARSIIEWIVQVLR